MGDPSLLRERHKQAKEHMEALGKEIERFEKQDGIWRPKIGKDYWLIDECGDMVASVNYECAYDTHVIKTGNCFRTEEEAQMYIKTKMRMIELSKPFDFDDHNWAFELTKGGWYANCWEKAQHHNAVYFTKDNARTIREEHEAGKINLDLTLGRWC